MESVNKRNSEPAPLKKYIDCPEPVHGSNTHWVT